MLLAPTEGCSAQATIDGITELLQHQRAVLATGVEPEVYKAVNSWFPGACVLVQ